MKTDSILIYHLPRPLYGLLLPEGIGHSSSGGDNHGADDSKSLLRDSLQRLLAQRLLAGETSAGRLILPLQLRGGRPVADRWRAIRFP